MSCFWNGSTKSNGQRLQRKIHKFFYNSTVYLKISKLRLDMYVKILSYKAGMIFKQLGFLFDRSYLNVEINRKKMAFLCFDVINKFICLFLMQLTRIS